SLAHGTHLVSYRVVSTDGHPIGGSLLFSVGEASGAPPPANAAASNLVAPIVAVRAGLYVAMMFGTGALVFLLFGPLPKPARRLSAGLSVVGIALLPLALGLQGLDALGRPLPEILAPETLSAGMATS